MIHRWWLGVPSWDLTWNCERSWTRSLLFGFGLVRTELSIESPWKFSRTLNCLFLCWVNNFMMPCQWRYIFSLSLTLPRIFHSNPSVALKYITHALRSIDEMGLRKIRTKERDDWWDVQSCRINQWEHRRKLMVRSTWMNS